MKSASKNTQIALALFFVGFSLQSEATVAVQRTLNSSKAQFKSYLEKSHGEEFSTSYIRLSEKMDPPTVQLENCLEEAYLGRSNGDACLIAVKALASRPLSSSGREILISLLLKIEKNQSPRKDFFHQLKVGLESTKTLSAVMKSPFAKLEVKAWKKVIMQKIPSEEMHLLVNGLPVSHFENWSPPVGVFQWALISNTYEPFIRLSSFNQFAAESVKELVPLADNCKSFKEYEIKKYGLLQAEVFASDACVAKDQTEKKESIEHLAQLPETPIMSSSKKNWLWTGISIVGLGLVLGLKGKNVQVGMPTFK